MISVKGGGKSQSRILYPVQIPLENEGKRLFRLTKAESLWPVDLHGRNYNEVLQTEEICQMKTWT